ncbi:MAG TPA: hypothetical protein VM431_06545 [Phycisphaerae bacterium]|nr:hypothetical protein [Phycisphaerae bacterium]
MRLKYWADHPRSTRERVYINGHGLRAVIFLAPPSPWTDTPTLHCVAWPGEHLPNDSAPHQVLRQALTEAGLPPRASWLEILRYARTQAARRAHYQGQAARAFDRDRLWRIFRGRAWLRVRWAAQRAWAFVKQASSPRAEA